MILRLSYVTEQVAEHTNGTIGALLNATFGNAPELLIATAALRSGFYRVVQLTMLGSMLTNLLFVFGLASLVGGLRWQVQELRMSSGNINVGFLLLSLAGSLLPATLVLSGQMKGEAPSTAGIPSKEELAFCRVNAVIMMIMYGCYLVFQLGTHKDEFEDGENTVATPNGNHLTLEPHFTSLHKKTRSARNMFCLGLWSRITKSGYEPTPPSFGDVELVADAVVNDSRDLLNGTRSKSGSEHNDDSSMSSQSADDSSADKLLPQNEPAPDSYFAEYSHEAENGSMGRRSMGSRARRPKESNGLLPGTTKRKKKKDFKPMLPLGLADPSEERIFGRSRSSCSLLHSSSAKSHKMLVFQLQRRMHHK
jgi:Ca2+/Na+ antiporter